MLVIEVPGGDTLEIKHILLDFNGTIALDGRLIKDVREKINQHSHQVRFHVITADTFGSVKKELEGVDCSRVVIPEANQIKAKQDYLQTLGTAQTIAVGNGANDESMLRDAVLGIAVLGREGLNTRTLDASDIVISNVLDLFGYLENTGRLVACLRR